MRDRLRRDYPVYRWINKLVGNGMMPGLVILEVTDDWIASERALIEQSRARGDRLLNVADVGDEPHCIYETRAAPARALNAVMRAGPVKSRLRGLRRNIRANIRGDRMSNYSRLGLRCWAEISPTLPGPVCSIPFLPQEGTHRAAAV